MSTFIIRSGGILSDSVFMPFSKDIKGKNIVICGAGTFGQQLVKRFEESKFCKLVAWVDDDYWEYRRCALNVDSIATISELNYDFVVIGMVDSSSAQKTRDRLIDFGVSPSKILALNVKDEAIELYLNKYLSYRN